MAYLYDLQKNKQSLGLQKKGKEENSFRKGKEFKMVLPMKMKVYCLKAEIRMW